MELGNSAFSEQSVFFRLSGIISIQFFRLTFLLLVTLLVDIRTAIKTFQL